MEQFRGFIYGLIIVLLLISSGLIYDKCTRDGKPDNPVINNPRDSIVPEQIIVFKDSIKTIWQTRWKTKNDTQYVKILDSFLVAELEKYKAEYLKLLDSLNVVMLSKIDTTFDPPVYMKKMNLAMDCMRENYTMTILKAQENWVINNPVQIYCPPRSFYDNPYVATGTGFLGGFLVGYFAGSISGGGK